MKEFRKSPRHYVASWEKPFIPTDAMIIGLATDCLLIEPEEFNSRYLHYEKFDKRSNADKEKWQKLTEQARDEKKQLITPEMIKTAQDTVKAIKEYAPAQPYLNMRKRHEWLRWTDKETGLPCIGQIDWDCMLDNQLCIVDLKTASDSDPDQFAKDAWSWEYFLQCGAYLEAYKTKYFQYPMFVFIVAETTDLHNVSINFVETKYMEFCREEWLGSMRAFKYCLDNNLWHEGYEFRLMGNMGYHALRKPGYGHRLFGNYDEK